MTIEEAVKKLPPEYKGQIIYQYEVYKNYLIASLRDKEHPLGTPFFGAMMYANTKTGEVIVTGLYPDELANDDEYWDDNREGEYHKAMIIV